MILHKNKIINIIYFLIITSIICIGAFFRIKQYCAGYLLCEDEINVHLNFLRYSWIHCFQVLDGFQMAPPIFLLFNKLLDSTIHNEIFALRIISCISGCLSLIFFYFLTKKSFKNKISIITALSLFALNPELIYYSAQLKPYSSDVLILILVFLLYEKLTSKNSNLFLTLLFVFILPFCSFTSLIAIGSVFIFNTFEILTDKTNEQNILESIRANKNNFFKIFIIVLTTFISSVIIYNINIDSVAGLKASWNNSFINLSVKSLNQSIINFLNFNYYKEPISVMLLLFGILASIYRRNKILTLSLIAFSLQIFAALIQLYPFDARLSLFLTPCLILLISSLVETNINPQSIIKSLFIIYIIILTADLIPLSKEMLGKNFSTIDSIISRENKKHETITFLNLYKDEDRFICYDDFFLQVQYYNTLYKYDHILDYYNAFEDIEHSLENIEQEIKDKPFQNFWLFGIVNSWVTDYFEISENDMKNIIMNTNRQYTIFPTKNGNIYYILKKDK